jgi:transcriptional regulator with XRE-family HTH domain
MKKDERLREIIDFLKKQHGLTNEKLSYAMGYRSKSYVSDILSGGKNAGKIFLEKLKRNYHANPEYIVNGTSPKFLQKSEKSEKSISRETNVTDDEELKERDYPYGENQMNLRVILNLTEANKKAIDNITILAQSNSAAVKTNEELVSMVKKSTAYAQPKITVDDAAMRSDFLELIARIGTGEKLWKSVDEGTAILSKFVLVPNVAETEEDIHAGSGIRRNKLDS